MNLRLRLIPLDGGRLRQLRIATPEGDYHLSVMMPKDDYERKVMLRRLETFMQWKQAMAFTSAVEVEKPAAIYATGMSRTERVNCIAQFRHRPKPWTSANFGEIRWLPESAIDSALVSMFPARPRALTPKESKHPVSTAVPVLFKQPG